MMGFTIGPQDLQMWLLCCRKSLKQFFGRDGSVYGSSGLVDCDQQTACVNDDIAFSASNLYASALTLSAHAVTSVICLTIDTCRRWSTLKARSFALTYYFPQETNDFL